jgi:Uma2 family endonuclease
MTARQFLLLGEDPPGVRLELVNGEIAVSPSPRPRHTNLDSHLRRILLNYLIEHDLGEIYGDTDTIFDEHNVRRPDIIYVSRERLAIVGDKAITDMPDLVVEILSPSSVEVDEVDKFALYESHGIANYWIIDPDAQRITAYVLHDGSYAKAAEVTGTGEAHLPPFPDLAIPLARLWPPR